VAANGSAICRREMTMADLTPTIDATGRRVIDVSGLPDSSTDSHEPVWWGNALLMFIETTSIILLIVSYFYIRRNFDAWPPPQPNTIPPIHNPVPDLPIPTLELVLMLASCIPMYVIDMAARRDEGRKVKFGLWFMFAVAMVVVILRFFEMTPSHLKFRWDDNAYGSIIWVILGTHLTYMLTMAAELFIMALWVTRHNLDPKHGLDVTLAGGFWYWAAATWAGCYAVVYWGARLL
jgi:cytochrome c oxidase subunit III